MKVVVLGAGIIGTTSAYFLAKQGHEVTVIDRQDSVSMETSHANAGCLSYGFTSPWASPGLPFSVLKWVLTGRSPLIINPNMSVETIKFLYRMYKNCNSRSYEINKSRMLRVANYSQKALLEIETDFDLYYEQKKQGSLQLFWDSKEIEKTQKDIAILDKFNINSQLLSAEECVKIEPGLQYVKNKLAGGIQFMDDFTGNCYLFSTEVYKKCVEMGLILNSILKLNPYKSVTIKSFQFQRIAVKLKQIVILYHSEATQLKSSQRLALRFLYILLKVIQLRCPSYLTRMLLSLQ